MVNSRILNSILTSCNLKFPQWEEGTLSRKGTVEGQPKGGHFSETWSRQGRLLSCATFIILPGQLCFLCLQEAFSDCSVLTLCLGWTTSQLLSGLPNAEQDLFFFSWLPGPYSIARLMGTAPYPKRIRKDCQKEQGFSSITFMVIIECSI